MPTLDPNRHAMPRKQPRQQRSIATVGIILDAAAHILEERGFDGFTTNTIAEKAGISIGSCYQYFPSKEAITAALITRETAQLAHGLVRAGEARTWQQGIRLAVAAAVSHQMERPRLALLLDMAEFVLGLSAEQTGVGPLAQAVISSLLRLDDAPKVLNIGQAAADLAAMAHGMIDGAGKRGETDEKSLNKRVLQAISGYLAAEK
jgi:AcrR family transcriptional regulator